MPSIFEFTEALLPYRPPQYQGNVLVTLSGGRSSGAMLALLLEQHRGKLPDNYAVVFNNTGMEHPKTLEFIHAIETNWNIDIHWIELHQLVSSSQVIAKRVDFATAARNGEPMEEPRRGKPGYTPRRAARICTLYMKTMLTDTYLQEHLHWTPRWNRLLGFRADEKHRLNRALLRCGADDKSLTIPDAPLVHASLSKRGVLAFWEAQPFDLGIPDHLGNCVFCFMKSEQKLRKAAMDMPEELLKWIALEDGYPARADGNNAPQYILPNGGYAALRQRVLDGLTPEDAEDYTSLECGCTD